VNVAKNAVRFLRLRLTPVYAEGEFTPAVVYAEGEFTLRGLHLQWVYTCSGFTPAVGLRRRRVYAARFKSSVIFANF